MFEQQITPALTHLSRVVWAAEEDEVSRRLEWGFKGRPVPDCYLIAAAMLREEGWKLLGSGAYSVALTHPSMAGKVLKVSLDADDAGPIWWDFCARNQGRPYVPVQYLHGTLMGLSFVIMDRLELDCSRAAYFTRGWEAEWDEDYAWLVEEAEALGYLDLHDENIMFHPADGTPFLTDPIYCGRLA